jgi:hypothetical protein
MQGNSSPDVAFHLAYTPGLPDRANQYAVPLESLVTLDGPRGPVAPQPTLRFVLIENYMIDLAWLTDACPLMMRATEGGVVVHGDSDDPAAAALPANYSYCRPGLMFPYGTHHTKMVIAFFDDAVKGECASFRVVARKWGVWGHKTLAQRAPGACQPWPKVLPCAVHPRWPTTPASRPASEAHHVAAVCELHVVPSRCTRTLSRPKGRS